MTIPKLEFVLRDAWIKSGLQRDGTASPFPAARAVCQYVGGQGLEAIGYCPLGSPGRPERDRTPEDTSPTEDPVILGIAKAHGVHPAAVCLKWAVQRGQTPIPFSAKPATTSPISAPSCKTRSRPRKWQPSGKSTAIAA